MEGLRRPGAVAVESACELVARVRREGFGFLTRAELAVLAADRSYRLQLVIVRCGGCRFICPAQDAGHLFEIIGRDGRDYVRDVAVWEPSTGF